MKISIIFSEQPTAKPLCSGISFHQKAYLEWWDAHKVAQELDDRRQAGHKEYISPIYKVITLEVVESSRVSTL